MAVTISSPSRRRVRRKPAPVALHVLLYAEDGAITAVCLETGAASCGPTPDAAVRMIDEALALLFEASDSDPAAASPFSTPATSVWWRALRGARLLDASPVALAGRGNVPRLAYLTDEPPGS